VKAIKVLHIASFSGNIGDNANHNGFRYRLKDKLGCNIHFDEIEIREFYRSWNMRDFNTEEFIDQCNSHDLVIFGGGNFFEIRWDYSFTGTTINISKDTLKKIDTPILFNAMGCDIATGYSVERVKRFGSFLEQITASEKMLVSVRNDGSYGTISSLYNGKFNDYIYRVPDGGFFIKTKQSGFPELDENRRSIGINIVSDMKDIRFNGSEENGIPYDVFIKQYAEEMNDFLKENDKYQLIFFPHIYSDLTAITDMLEYMDDWYRRERIKVAPCIAGPGSEEYIFGLYKMCDLIMGMRFHSNVCSIAQNIPTIALCSYKKIHDLYKEVGLPDRVVEVNKAGFREKLRDEIQNTIGDLDRISAEYRKVNEKLYLESEPFYSDIKLWCERNGIL